MAQVSNSPNNREVPSILDKMTLLPSDKVLGVIIALLFVLSLIVVYSSSANVAYRHGVSTELFLRRHIITLAMTAGVMIVAYVFPLKWVHKLTCCLLYWRW